MNNFKNYIENNNLEKAIESRGSDGETVLHYLCNIGDEDCILKIMNTVRNMMRPKDMKRYVNTQDSDGNTALHIASRNGNNIIANMLELYGANPMIKNNNEEIVSVKIDSDSDDNIKCGEEKKMKNLIERLTKPTEVYNITNREDIVSSENKDRGNIVTNLFKSAMKQNGGADTDELLERLSHGLVGGANKNKKSTVSDIHTEVIQMIRDLGYSDDESKVIKAGLYNYVKSEHPNLKSKDRAEKMKDYVTKKHIASIDIMALKQAIQIHYENKNKSKK